MSPPRVVKTKHKLIPPTVVRVLAQDILFTVSGVFCIGMPVRVLELFQETLRGGSDMSLRAAEMQYRSTDEEKTKDTGLTLDNLCVGLFLCC